jgi:hypothetical protein
MNLVNAIIQFDMHKVHGQPITERGRHNWVEGLSDEDLAFIKRFVLASGSLKALAKDYGISYPTVRLRLDRLIEKVRVLDSRDISSEFERLLRTLYADGRIDMTVLNEVLAAHREELEKSP